MRTKSIKRNAALVAGIIALALAVCLMLISAGGGSASANETDAAEPAVITQKTTTVRDYQGQDNWYYLCGDFSQNELYRMYYNSAPTAKWWQGIGDYANFLNPQNSNAMYPINTDMMMAYVVPTYADISMVGRILTWINSDKTINVKIIHRSADGDTVLDEHAMVNAATEDTYNVAQKEFTAAAGDVIFFLAEGVDGLDAWNGVTFDVNLTLSEVGGKAETPVSLLSDKAMPMTGAHNITVTGGVVDYHAILTESMKLDQTANQKYCFRGTDGAYALFGCRDDNNGEKQYYVSGDYNYSNCSTGIQANRVFYANNGWTGASGMMYYAPANGKISLLGKAVVNANVTAQITKLAADGTATTVASLSTGEVAFADVADANDIKISAGEALVILFDGPAWNTSSMAATFDFTVTPDMYVCVSAVDATCTEGGNVRYYIHGDKKYSDREFTVEIVDEDIAVGALGHNISHVEAADATCTESGHVACYHCDRCGKYFEDEEGATEKTDAVTPALGHDMTYVAALAPDCTTPGNVAYYHCNRCALNFEDEDGNEAIADVTVAAKGHTEVTYEGHAATCTETGLTAGSHCSECNAVLVAQEEIPAKGHTEVTDEGRAATCTETGLTTGSHCSECSAVLVAQEEIPAKGHTFVDGACSVCGAADPDANTGDGDDNTDGNTGDDGNNDGNTGDNANNGGDNTDGENKKKCGANVGGSFAALAALLLAAAGMCVVFAKRKA